MKYWKCLLTALPIIVKLITAYLSTVLPNLSKTTPFMGDFTTAGVSNVTISPLLSSTFYSSTSAEFYESNETSNGSYGFTTAKSKRTKKPGKKRKGSTKKPKFKRQVSNQNGLPRSTEPPDEDYTQPDWSRYPVVSDEEEDDGFVLRIGTNGNGFYGKSSTRGDIPSESKEDPSTTTTTEMPSTTAVAVTEPTTPESLDKFLTNVMTMVTMVAFANMNMQRGFQKFTLNNKNAGFLSRCSTTIRQKRMSWTIPKFRTFLSG
jgi:hypothetical protein